MPPPRLSSKPFKRTDSPAAEGASTTLANAVEHTLDVIMAEQIRFLVEERMSQQDQKIEELLARIEDLEHGQGHHADMFAKEFGLDDDPEAYAQGLASLDGASRLEERLLESIELQLEGKSTGATPSFTPPHASRERAATKTRVESIPC